MLKGNSEILFLYDARLCNPNGDPDEENRPRMDYETGRNLVSDVRLKRYLRDFWLNFDESFWTKLGYDNPQDIWVRKEEENGQPRTVTAKKRIESLAEKFKPGKKAKDLSKDPEFPKFLKKHLVDLRIFGATVPIEGEKESKKPGASLTFTGPVQFTWGYSLNKVEILPSSTISSTFAGRETGEKGEYGTFGKDWRVKYSFLAFWGQVSAMRARETEMTETDLALLDRSLFEALPLMATTRSKIGQTPRLYLRVEYRDSYTFLGDYREPLKLTREEGLESIEDVEIDFSGLERRLSEASEKIQKIFYRVHPAFKNGKAFVEALKTSLGGMEFEEVSRLELS